jgi:hypothetical protein
LAQDAPQELLYGTPVEGSIDNSSFTQSWSLITASADRLNVIVERTSGNLIPDVSILDTNNQAINQSYGAERDAATARIDSFSLPSGGEYQILVGREGAETGLTSGGYRLTVIPLATADDNINNTTVVGPITVDTPVTGEISATHWYQRYTFEAPAPDTVYVTARRTSGTLFPEVQILDANGQNLNIGYNDYTGDFAETNFYSLPAAGTYTVVATRDRGFNGESTGGYEMTVNLIGAGEGNPSLAEPLGTVTYDTLIQGTITGAKWYQDWVLQTQAGDTITIIVDRSDDAEGGNLQPEVALLGAAGQELTRGYTDYSGEHVGSRAVIDRYQLDVPGTYTVRVTRAGGQTRPLTGKYNLTVHLAGAGEGSPNLTTPAGSVEVGGTAEGEVTDAVWGQIWTLENPVSQNLRITVTRTSGTLIPLFEVQDANGQVLASPYFEQTRDTVIYEYGSPLPLGTYKIFVLRENRQNGVTTGGYTLTVEAVSE